MGHQHRKATEVSPTSTMILNRPVSFCFRELIFLVVAKQAWQPDSLIPTPALAETGNQGRVCNQPSQCRAPWGQYTLVLDPSASTTTTALSKYRWEPRAGGDRVSRHPSSTGLRFSPPPPWVNIYFWQIQLRQEGNPLWPEKWDSAFLSFCSSHPAATRDEPTITL